MKGEFHDFIIWDNAKHKYDFLFNELKKKFQMIDVHEITCTKENFEKNLRRFYGTTLPNPQKKMKQCGIGPILVIIYFDPNPIYQFRKTSLGLLMTNVNVYDTKSELRTISFLDFFCLIYPIILLNRVFKCQGLE